MRFMLGLIDDHLFVCSLVVLGIKIRAFHPSDECSILELYNPKPPPPAPVSSVFSYSKSIHMNHSLPGLERNKIDLR